MTFTGEVCDGHGSASRDVKDGVYDIDGLYPGTLNLKVAGDVTAALDAPDMVVDYAGIERRLWAGSVGDVDVHVLHAGWVDRVELLAAVSLRDTLKLSNGDEVTVTVG